jgi:hypothetical protein
MTAWEQLFAGIGFLVCLALATLAAAGAIVAAVRFFVEGSVC